MSRSVTAALREIGGQLHQSWRSMPNTARRVRREPRSIVGGASLTPLVVLYGHIVLDAVDGAGFAVILPDIRRSFDISLAAVSLLGGLTIMVALLLSVPIAVLAERTRHRVAYLAAGAYVAAAFSVAAGVATSIVLFTVARGGMGLGLRLNEPVQQSLIADYYPVSSRATVFSGREMTRRLGLMLGPLLFGGATALFGWRSAILGFAVPALALAVISSRLHNPVKGGPERAAMGLADEDAPEDDPPTLEEAYAILGRISTVRRLWYLLPFVVGGLLALTIYLPLFAEEVFGLDAAARGATFAVGEAAAVLGLIVATPLTARFLASPTPERVFPLLAIQSVFTSSAVVLIAVAPGVVAFVVGLVLLSFFGALLTPVTGVLLSLVIPPRVRTIGFAVGALWVLPGVLSVAVIAAVGEAHGVRWGVGIAAPLFLVGGVMMGTAGRRFRDDLRNATLSSVAVTDDNAARSAGRAKLLVCRGIDLSYGQVQVLFGVDFDVEQGEMVALLGTNGAGKSSLLRAISGIAQPKGGTILFDGKDITSAAPARTAELGIIQVPGGRGVFPTMTVAENLRVATWLHRHDPVHVREAVNRSLDLFPVLRTRADQLAGSLSGGEQQMLTLAQAFIARPRLLLIDELSLGLAPLVVGQLLEMVRAIHKSGVTVVLVEQSVNIALTVCDRAAFMEKGEVRFEGPTAELLERPDVLRSVFLGGATNGSPSQPHANTRPPASGRVVTPTVVLEARNLTKRFGGICAVDDVSITLHDGEILGLIGTNGAGKTTLFDLLSGFVPADSGTVALDGVDITRRRAAQRSLGRLGRSFQDARLFRSLSVHDNICVALERHLQLRSVLATVVQAPADRDQERAVRQRADELIERLGLDAYRDKFVFELSTGTRRIVDLACAMAHEPRVLLVDEPSSGIAQRETEALGPLLRRFHDELGCSLIIIEHDIALISSVSDRLIALEAGRVIATGLPDDVLTDPAVVASYLGTDAASIARSGAPQPSTSRDLVAP